MENNYSKGAEWRKWDLHLHTPSSYDYQNNAVSNIDIIEELAKNDINVAAITDHHVIDVERIKSLQLLGKDKNITILPGIEFLSDARGSEPIHFIGIFAEDCNLAYVWGQIQNKTEISKIISELKEPNQVYCHLIETINLIHELGGVVTIHSGKKHSSIETITNSLQHTIAQKTDIAKNVDIYELGQANDQKGYIDIVFPAIGKRLPMIIGSDNHKISEYILKSNCWIKADPTFEGLKQIINEPEGRVFIGDKPFVFDRIITNRTKYIKELDISQVEGYDGRYGQWFDDVKIPLNSELVAIIGNKGSGKSAIADMIALCGDFNNHDDFSFLRKKKFRDGKHAKNFIASLLWESGKVVPRNLDGDADEGAIEEVKYLPQGQFERLTNEVSSTEEFQNEIEKVVFTHIDESERYNTSTFGDLIKYQKQSVDAEIESLVKDLNQINADIILLESKENPAYKAELMKKKEKKEEELKALIEPPMVSDPNEDPAKKKASEDQLKEITRLKENIATLETQQKETEGNKKQLLLDLQLLKQTRKELEFKAIEIQQYAESKKEALLTVGIDISKALVLKTDYSQFESTIQIKEQTLSELKILLGEGELTEPEIAKSLPILQSTAQKMLESEQTKLGTEQKAYQQYLLAKATWERKKKEIKGDTNTPDTIEFYKFGIDYIETNLSVELEEIYQLRKLKLKEIFKRKLDVINIYKAVKNRIDSVIDQNKELLKTYPINIEASLVLKPEFIQKFMSFINKQKAGTFRNINDGEIQLKQIISGVDFDNEDAVINFLDSIIRALKEDQREGQDNNQYRFVGDQVSEIEELYTYLFSLNFLDYNYQLKQGDKKLEQLSPGERGALLLIFYLILDKNDIPLIIDQPEDNLDNYSVANILVPFIREAKKKRQIIMVTHNPNLAVVADAEQVIFANLEKENDNKFSFISGSIENREVNKCIVKVLEGAMPAFNKRKQKYYE